MCNTVQLAQANAQRGTEKNCKGDWDELSTSRKYVDCMWNMTNWNTYVFLFLSRPIYKWAPSFAQPVLFVLSFIDWNVFYCCVLTAQTWLDVMPWIKLRSWDLQQGRNCLTVMYMPIEEMSVITEVDVVLSPFFVADVTKLVSEWSTVLL